MTFLDKLLNIIYPPVCGFCDEINENFLCDKCKNKFEKIKLNKIDDYNNVPVYFKEHYYIFKYEDEIRDLIIKYKFQDKSYLYKTFAKIILDNENFINNFIENYDCIISVPIHKKRMKIRGYNQSQLIAKEIAVKCGMEFYKDVLIKNKNIVAQSTLDKLDRVKNIQGAFKVKDNIMKINNKRILIFDDIFTTGSTVNECARVLIEKGVKSVGVCTLAKD